MHSSASLSWFALVVVGLVVLGGIACLSALLANRHTRGTTKSFLGFGTFVAVALVAVMFWVRSSSHQIHVARAQQQQLGAQLQTQNAILEQARLMASEVETSGLDPESARAQLQQAAALVEEAERMIQAGEISPHDGHLRQMKANEAQHWQQIADGYAATPGVEHLASDYQQRAQQARADADRYAQRGQAVTAAPLAIDPDFSLGLPLMLLVCVAVVFMAFKHGGTTVGFTVLALPLLLAGFSMLAYTNVRAPQPAVPLSSASPSRWEPEFAAENLADQLFIDAQHRLPYPNPVVEVPAEDSSTPTTPLPPEKPAEVVASTSEESKTEESGDTDAEAAAAETLAVSNDLVQPSEPTTADNKLPEWVKNPEKSVPHVYRRLIESDWRDSADTCQRHNAIKIEQAVHEYVQELANEHTYGAYVPSLAELGVTPRYIREQILKEHHYASRDFAHQSGMVNLYQQLEFDSRVSEDLASRWRTYARQQNVAGIAVVSGSVLAALAGVLGLIKLDTYTKGFYTKRLFIGVPAAIIGFIMLVDAMNG